ncbi:EamA family transporter [Candidatus Woesearchaeota archaeon]|nr:EamA family transporter [Candidatus Woesearchaeota archaeon]
MEWFYFAGISAILSAFAAIIEKKALFKDRALDFVLVLAIFNMILASIFLFYIDFSKITSISLIVLLFKAVLNGIAFVGVMFAIKNLELSDALPLLVLTPGFVALFAWIFLKESLTNLEIFGLFLLTLGVYIFQTNRSLLDPFKKLKKGYKFIILALTLFTITTILDRVLLNKYKLQPTALMSFQHFFFFFIFLAMFLIFDKRKNIKNFGKTLRRDWILILILSLVTIGYRYFEILAIKTTTSTALALAVKRTSVFFAVVIGGELFKEHNLLKKTIATLLLIIGAILVIRF